MSPQRDPIATNETHHMRGKDRSRAKMALFIGLGKSPCHKRTYLGIVAGGETIPATSPRTFLQQSSPLLGGRVSWRGGVTKGRGDSTCLQVRSRLGNLRGERPPHVPSGVGTPVGEKKKKTTSVAKGQSITKGQKKS